MNMEFDYAYVVGKQDFDSGIIYEPRKVFLYEGDAKKYCEQINKRLHDGTFYTYQKLRFYN